MARKLRDEDMFHDGDNFGGKEESERFGDAYACVSIPPSSSITLQCEDNQSLFRVEVTTDRLPEQTSWELLDVSSNTTGGVLKDTENQIKTIKRFINSNKDIQEAVEWVDPSKNRFKKEELELNI